MVYSRSILGVSFKTIDGLWQGLFQDNSWEDKAPSVSTLLPKPLYFCNLLHFSFDKIEERDRKLPMLPRIHVETWGVTQPIGGVVNEVPSGHDGGTSHSYCMKNNAQTSAGSTKGR